MSVRAWTCPRPPVRGRPSNTAPPLRQLTVHTDGCVSESLDVPSATCTGPAVLLLGHGGAAGDGDSSAIYELSSVLSFSEPVLDLEQAFILRLLGPNCTDLTACS